MTAFLSMLFVGAGLLYLAENNSKTSPFVVALFFFLTGAFALAGLSSLAAVYSAFAILSAVYVVSRLKARMTRFPLFYNDLLAFDFAVLRDIVALYRWQAAVAMALMVLLALLAIWAHRSLMFDVGWWGAVALLLAGGTAIRLSLRRAMDNTRGWQIHRAYITAFFGQAIEQRLRRTAMRALDVAEAVPVENVDHPPSTTAQTAPHILLLVHESTFPPSLYGFPEEDDVRQFLRGYDGGRSLVTEVFGGQSIMSSFSCQTGLPISIFGAARFYATRFWAGHIGVSLPNFLRAHGYHSTSILSCDGSWMGIGPFYRSIGFDTVLQPGDYAARSSLPVYADRDRLMFAAAADEIARRIAAGIERTYTLVETLGNHAPHDFAKFEDARIAASKEWFVAECERLGLAPPAAMVEYYGRLRATVDDYAALRARLAREHPAEDFVIINIGDHQPPFVNALPEEGDRRYRTFLSVDTIGTVPASSLPGAIESPWEIFNVDIAVAAYAGLPLSGFLKSKLATVRTETDCGATQPSQAYAGIVRGLERAGLLNSG